MQDFAALRQRMVDNQIRTSAVTDHAVIKAFLTIPREMFVAPSEQPFAYADRELIMLAGAQDRRMMEPVQLARMVQLLHVMPGAAVLVIGCGAGYSVAILAMLAGSVVGLEEDERLAARAVENLRELGATGAQVAVGTLVEGLPRQGPFDAILIDGAVEFVPDALIAQLKPEGALAAAERSDSISRAMLYERVGGEATKWPYFEAGATLLPGFARPPQFTF